MSVKCKGFLPILAIFIFSVFVSCSADVVWGTQESFSSQIEKATTEATGTETKMPKISYTFYAQKLSENPNASHATFELPLGKWICSSYSEETASTLEYNSLPSYYSDFTNAINPGYYISGWLYYNPTNENGTYNNFTKEDENSSESHGNLVDSEHYEWIQKKISYTYRLRDTSSSVLIEEVHENFTYSKWNTETESYDVSETCNAYISGCLVTKYQLSFVASSWLPRSDTKYTVYHYVEDADNEGKYKLYETETFTGITDDEVTVCCKSSDENYSHFDLKSDEEENKTLTIKGDGSSSENFYYDRKTYYITVCGGTFEDSDGNTLYGTITDTSTANDYDTDNENPTWATWAKKEGATLDLASLVSLDGYYVSSWKEVITYSDGTTGDPTYYDADEVPSEIQAYNVTYTPVWSIIPVTYNISYHIVSSGDYGSNDVLTLTSSQISSLGLPSTHTNTDETTIPIANLSTLTDGDTSTSTGETASTISFGGLYSDSSLETQLSDSSSDYTIGATSLSEDLTVYIKVSVDHIYIDPTNGSDKNFGFSLDSPCKSLTKAFSWISPNLETSSSSSSATSSAATIYVLSSITSSSDLSRNYYNAVLKRHANLTSSPVISLSSGSSTIQNLVVDGGASWSGLDDVATSGVSVLSNSGISATCSCVVVSSGVTLTCSNVTFQNNENSSSKASALDLEGTANLTDCVFNYNVSKTSSGALYTGSSAILQMSSGSFSYNATKNGNGGAVVVASAKGDNSPSNIYFDTVNFSTNFATGNGGAVSINTGKYASFNACTFTDNGYDSTSTSSSYLGIDIYAAGSLYLAGNCAFCTSSEIYTTTSKVIILNSDFTVVSSDDSSTSSTVKLTPKQYITTDSSGNVVNKSVHVLTDTSGSDDADLSSLIGYFTLADSDNYYLTTDGYIAMNSSTTLSVGTPSNYIVSYTESSDDGEITISVKNSSSSTEITPATCSVAIYQSTDLITTYSDLQNSSMTFTFPTDLPEGNYILYVVITDDNYYYDYSLSYEKSE